jgi:hypothetical protein
MSADESNVANPVRIIDHDNQTVLVSLDVEHDSVLPDDACVRVDPLHVRRTAPIGLTNVVVRSRNGCSASAWRCQNSGRVPRAMIRTEILYRLLPTWEQDVSPLVQYRLTPSRSRVPLAASRPPLPRRPASVCRFALRRLRLEARRRNSSLERSGAEGTLRVADRKVLREHALIGKRGDVQPHRGSHGRPGPRQGGRHGQGALTGSRRGGSTGLSRCASTIHERHAKLRIPKKSIRELHCLTAGNSAMRGTNVRASPMIEVQANGRQRLRFKAVDADKVRPSKAEMVTL